MSTPLDLKLDPEKVQEIPMVDLAFMVLKAANTPFYYRDLMNEVAKLRGLTEEQINDVIAQLYTEINIDGRFACVGGQNLWGLKRWYPVDRSEEAITGGTPRPRIINDDDDDDYADDDNYNNDEEEDFDFVDEDGEEEEEIFEDEDSDVEDDVDIEEEIDEEDADLNEEENDDFEEEDDREEDM
ncbi:DNA-directed RNA polymerase subunit delta [Paenibacillus alvei TS-15]|jgi:DNA-directed RNA polymerase subunit delta|uniref:Probable DNA-directed RNA polymerase subunit delta n=1 Tax=Paenibacillus alvei TS-15 TaxID=1117108 RepID=S9SMN3_PAEAL|nr:DNA-directed RNA polymerase subunit delta [Paenibacillus alvei]EPY07012.1 DNA-directed RNA polymerase subunit delta [Paenibacillus alvei TS-15]